VSGEISPGKIEEYRVLRQTIFEAQKTRMQTLAFTLTATGAILTLLFTGNSPPSAGKGFGLIALAGLIVAAALVLTIRGTRGIDHAATYLREFVEKPELGIAWETRWAAFRATPPQIDRSSSVTRALAAIDARIQGAFGRSPRFGASRGYALAYGLVGLLGIPYLWFAAVPHRHLVQSVILVAETATVSLLALDLFLRFTPGWADPLTAWRAVAAAEAEAIGQRMGRRPDDQLGPPGPS
jgi:hypothetical protein